LWWSVSECQERSGTGQESAPLHRFVTACAVLAPHEGFLALNRPVSLQQLTPLVVFMVSLLSAYMQMVIRAQFRENHEV
jgi:hypothetical protein